jgi:hypothetical protein
MIDGLEVIGKRLLKGCHGNLKLLILYGSESGNSDADYLAVFDNLLRSNSLTVGGVDLWAISESELKEYIMLVDPFVTEPLLTGRLAYGSKQLLEGYRDDLKSTKISLRAIRYLLSRSVQSYIAACERLSKQEAPMYMLNRDYWSALSFSISYWCYARLYARDSRKAVALKTAIESSPQSVRRLWSDIQARKNESANRTDAMLDTWTRILLRDMELEQRDKLDGHSTAFHGRK